MPGRVGGYCAGVDHDVTLLANPTAGRGRGAKLTSAVRDRLTAAGLRVDLAQGRDAAHSAELARAHVGRGTAALVVLGGDGMAFLALQALAGTATPLGIVPAGTGNDLAGALGVPEDPMAAADQVAAAVLGGHTRPVDAVRAGERWWGSVLCAGFDSAVNARVNAMRWPRGRLRYELAVFLEVLRLAPRRVRLTLDGERQDLDVTLVAVGNGYRYGGGFRVCPHAEIDDGMLDVTVIRPVSRMELIRFKPTLRRGEHESHPAVSMHRAREVSIEGAGISAFADGEALGELPVTATCVPGALTVLAAPDAGGAVG